MARYGLVTNGVVVNVINYDGSSSYPIDSDSTLVELPAGVGTGWTFSEGAWTPPPVVPHVPPLNPISTGRLLNVRKILSSGAYTPTAGTNIITVELVGGGGGASTAASSAGQQRGLGSAGVVIIREYS